MPALTARLLGYGLFAFIPAVLWLFVRHPEPVGWSLAAGVGLMLGHRFLARPYMARVKEQKCLWCNRMPLPAEALSVPLVSRSGEVTEARCCSGHELPLRRFFTFLGRFGKPMAVGIFLPLLALLGALVATAVGKALPLDGFVAAFQLIVGLTVSVAAWGYPLVEPRVTPGPVAFPLHNFFLLGVRSLTWIFRIVGAWWVVRGFLP